MGQNAINEDTGFFNEDTRSFWSTVNDGEEVSAGGAASLLIKNRKVFTYEYADNSYKIIATPTVNQDANSGKLLLSFNGNKYEKKWDKNNDNSYSEDW